MDYVGLLTAKRMFLQKWKIGAIEKILMSVIGLVVKKVFFALSVFGMILTISWLLSYLTMRVRHIRLFIIDNGQLRIEKRYQVRRKVEASKGVARG